MIRVVPTAGGRRPDFSRPHFTSPIDSSAARDPLYCMSKVIVPEDGPSLPGDFEVVVKVRSEHTDGVMSVIEETIPPGRLSSPHTHINDVWVFVLSGEVGVLIGDNVALAKQGSWALKPRNVVHAMWNPATVPARVVEVLTPGGSERWCEELAACHLATPRVSRMRAAVMGSTSYASRLGSPSYENGSI